MEDKKKSYILARRRVRRGDDKGKIFDEHKDSLGVSQLSNLLASYPDKVLFDKYRKLNIVLISALVVATILKTAALVELLYQLDFDVQSAVLLALVGALINVAAIYAIYIKHAMAYRIVGLFALQGVFKVFDPVLISSYSSLYDWVWLSLSVICLATVIWLSFVLAFKMFPHHGWFSPKRGDDGNALYSQSQIEGIAP